MPHPSFFWTHPNTSLKPLSFLFFFGGEGGKDWPLLHGHVFFEVVAHPLSTKRFLFFRYLSPATSQMCNRADWGRPCQGFEIKGVGGSVPRSTSRQYSEVPAVPEHTEPLCWRTSCEHGVPFLFEGTRLEGKTTRKAVLGGRICFCTYPYGCESQESPSVENR